MQVCGPCGSSKTGLLRYPYTIGNGAVTLLDPQDVAFVTQQHPDFLVAVQADDIQALKKIMKVLVQHRFDYIGGKPSAARGNEAAMTDICGKRCGASDYVKNGIVREMQRTRCKSCGCNFTATPARGKPPRTKALALLLYAMGNMSFCSIARILGVSGLRRRRLPSAASMSRKPARSNPGRCSRCPETDYRAPRSEK